MFSIFLISFHSIKQVVWLYCNVFNGHRDFSFFFLCHRCIVIVFKLDQVDLSKATWIVENMFTLGWCIYHMVYCWGCFFYVFEDYLYMGFLFLDYFDLFEVDLFYWLGRNFGYCTKYIVIYSLLLNIYIFPIMVLF